MNLRVFILIFKSDEDRQLKDELLLCVERLKVKEKFFLFFNLYLKKTVSLNFNKILGK
jgi:hypothetical protein